MSETDGTCPNSKGTSLIPLTKRNNQNQGGSHGHLSSPGYEKLSHFFALSISEVSELSLPPFLLPSAPFPLSGHSDVPSS